MEPFLPTISLFISPYSLDHRHGYPFRPLSLVGSYQVGYTRSHPNTEVKMLRACSVPLCSRRWERQVIYLFTFFFFFTFLLFTLLLLLLCYYTTIYILPDFAFFTFVFSLLFSPAFFTLSFFLYTFFILTLCSATPVSFSLFVVPFFSSFFSLFFFSFIFPFPFIFCLFSL